MRGSVASLGALLALAACAQPDRGDGDDPIGMWSGGEVYVVSAGQPEDRSRTIDVVRCAAATVAIEKGYARFAEARMEWPGPDGPTRSPFAVDNSTVPATVSSPYAFFGPAGSTFGATVSATETRAGCEVT
ncbi:MAG: hypothetical protein AAFU59_03750 [Pseudomonadota bacterium]